MSHPERRLDFEPHWSQHARPAPDDGPRSSFRPSAQANPQLAANKAADLATAGCVTDVGHTCSPSRLHHCRAFISAFASPELATCASLRSRFHSEESLSLLRPKSLSLRGVAIHQTSGVRGVACTPRSDTMQHLNSGARHDHPAIQVLAQYGV